MFSMCDALSLQCVYLSQILFALISSIVCVYTVNTQSLSVFPKEPQFSHHLSPWKEPNVTS